jgi:hypothetical protein
MKENDERREKIVKLLAALFADSTAAPTPIIAEYGFTSTPMCEALKEFGILEKLTNPVDKQKWKITAKLTAALLGDQKLIYQIEDRFGELQSDYNRKSDAPKKEKDEKKVQKTFNLNEKLNRFENDINEIKENQNEIKTMMQRILKELGVHVVAA